MMQKRHGLVACLLWAAVVAATFLASAPQVRAAELYRVCLVQNPGFTNCTVGGDPFTFSGLDVDLIRSVAGGMGWREVAQGTDVSNFSQTAYTFVCTSIRVPAMISILGNVSNPNMTDCALGAGAVTATLARAQGGIRFAWPHLHSSLGVMVYSGSQSVEYDRWAFLQPFSTEIWIAVVLNTVLTPVVLSLFENLIQTGRIPVGMSLLNEWRHASYTMFLCCFNLTVLTVLSFPCQLIIICFAFTNLIMVASYTANLAAVLTSAATATGIQTLHDLVGRAVAAHGVYVDRLLNNNNIRAQSLNWGGEPFFQQVKELLISGRLSAYIFDRHILQYWIVQENQDCAVSLLQDTNLEPFDYAIPFHVALPDTVVNTFSLGVLYAQSKGTVSLLEQRFLTGSARSCGASDSETPALVFAQVAGLYIILGCATALGLVASVYSVWWYHIYQPRKLKRQQAEEDAAAFAISAAELDFKDMTNSEAGLSRKYGPGGDGPQDDSDDREGGELGGNDSLLLHEALAAHGGDGEQDASQHGPRGGGGGGIRAGDLLLGVPRDPAGAARSPSSIVRRRASLSLLTPSISLSQQMPGGGTVFGSLGSSGRRHSLSFYSATRPIQFAEESLPSQAVLADRWSSTNPLYMRPGSGRRRSFHIIDDLTSTEELSGRPRGRDRASAHPPEVTAAGGDETAGNGQVGGGLGGAGQEDSTRRSRPTGRSSSMSMDAFAHVAKFAGAAKKLAKKVFVVEGSAQDTTLLQDLAASVEGVEASGNYTAFEMALAKANSRGLAPQLPPQLVKMTGRETFISRKHSTSLGTSASAAIAASAGSLAFDPVSNSVFAVGGGSNRMNGSFVWTEARVGGASRRGSMVISPNAAALQQLRMQLAAEAALSASSSQVPGSHMANMDDEVAHTSLPDRLPGRSESMARLGSLERSLHGPGVLSGRHRDSASSRLGMSGGGGAGTSPPTGSSWQNLQALSAHRHSASLPMSGLAVGSGPAQRAATSGGGAAATAMARTPTGSTNEQQLRSAASCGPGALATPNVGYNSNNSLPATPAARWAAYRSSSQRSQATTLTSATSGSMVGLPYLHEEGAETELEVDDEPVSPRPALHDSSLHAATQLFMRRSGSQEETDLGVRMPPEIVMPRRMA